MQIWTDGCCNKKNSGWAVIIPSLKIIFRGELPGGTNQQTELGSIIQAVYFVRQNYPSFLQNLHIITDSQYSIDCFTSYYPNWLKNGWITSKGEPVKNQPFIKLGLQLGVQTCKFQHVGRNSGDYYNQMADYYSKNPQLKLEHQDWTLING